MSRKCTFHILRCDSSDKAHPVQSARCTLQQRLNLAGIVKNDAANYWQTEGPSKETSVTIEFDKLCTIDSFELGAPLR
jgi:hypothetical protein